MSTRSFIRFKLSCTSFDLFTYKQHRLPMIAHCVPCRAACVARRRRFQSTEANLLTPDGRAFKVCGVPVNPCSLTLEVFRIASSRSEVFKLGKRVLTESVLRYMSGLPMISGWMCLRGATLRLKEARSVIRLAFKVG